MSNKLTRKSLAFGAMVALASSVIAGAPAQAAGEVVFAPTSGTSYNTFVTEQFSLNASLAPGQVAANISQLKYKVDSAVASSVWISTGNAITTPVIGGVAAATSVVVAATTPSSTAANIITLKLATSAATTATTSVTVTAFLDSNNDNLLTAGEFEQARTVKFMKYSEVLPTVALTPVLAGDVTAKATATYADLNTQQLTASDFTVTFTVAGATGADAAPGVVAASGVYTDSGLTGVAAAAAVTAQAYYKTVALGTAVTGTVAAQTIATNVAALVEGPDAKVISTVPTARLNTAFAVKSTVKAAAVGSAAALPVAGVAVTAAITTSATLSSTITLSVNGTVYTSATLPTALALTSDANGEVKVDLKSVGFSDADTVSVVFTSQNIVATTLTVTQKATAYAITADEGNLYSTPLGTPQAIALSVKDQFGTLTTKSDRIAVTTSIGSGLTAFTTGTTYVTLSGGKGTYSATSGTATAAGQISLATSLEAQSASTLNWAAYSPAVTGAAAILVNVTTVANSFATAPAATATAKVTPDAYTSAISNTAGYSAVYSVTVTNPGTMVTVAAPGAYIKVGSTFGEGTASERSPANGVVAVVVYAKTVGSLTATFTNGVAVKTSVITLTTDLAPALVSMAAPAQAQVGQAMDVVISVTDKWGNAVATPTSGTNAGILSVSSTGTGYFASAAPVANAAGKATVKYIVGTADIGTAFLSATLDLATDVTAARSVEFGLTDGDVLAGGKRIFVSAEFAKGRTVSVSINGKRIYSKVQTTDNAVELAFTQRRAGTYTVTVRISGGITFTEKVTVG
jgi:hypothetical protein